MRYKTFLKLAGWLLLSFPAWCWAGIPTPPRQAELLYMLEQDCGSCHGLRRAGGLGPPLTPEALAGKPPQYLEATISHGRPGTPMPPWRPFMTEAEVSWLVEQLLNPYPAETSRP